MHKTLVIVESPAKAKTISKYLGKDYQVLASYGHVRDLLPKKGAVLPDEGFKLVYQPIAKNSKYFAKIVSVVSKVDSILLATDPDREGEAISWHIIEMLKAKRLLKDQQVHRVVFHEITKKAIQAAVNNPKDVSMNLVNAQQARRALDYLVGFNLSPLLWKKIRKGLSAGRVQSPALRMIVERDAKIKDFVSQEYWSVKANLAYKEQSFVANLTSYANKKLEQFSITNNSAANTIVEELKQAAKGELTVAKVENKQRKRNPAPPFITSTLQQEAARKLGFSAQRTMKVAQQLYEGVRTGKDSQGLITYMRTDSVTLAKEAVFSIRQFITEKYGADKLPNSPRMYKSKSKNSQEAHEAIRPTNYTCPPDKVASNLDKDQNRLYELIWKRTIACQMIPATINTVAVNLPCGDSNFKANGSSIADKGFMSVYLEDKDDKPATDEEKMLPVLSVGDKVAVKDIIPEQHFTEPPPMFTEASLVKNLEENDIGRPSTYASIIATLQQRDYVILEKKRFQPTDVGVVVSNFLTKYFTKYVDYNFTANLEDKLDAIARGEQKWQPLLEDFWQPFIELIEQIQNEVKKETVTTEELDEQCPQCNKPVAIRLGRNGKFIGCTGYPTCNYTKGMGADDDADDATNKILDRQCPNCQQGLILKEGRYGKFIGCTGYPTCKYIEPLNKPQDTKVKCPACNHGTILKRKSRKGKVFYSCDGYPTCKYAIWHQPVDEVCPKCAWPILTIKETKSNGKQKLCAQDGCNYSNKIT